MQKRNDSLIGQKFEKLTVIDREFGHKKATYICRCDCGKTKKVRKDHLKSGRTKSCGCSFSEFRKRATRNWVNPLLKPDNYTAKYNLYKRYRATAWERKLEFSVPILEFVEIAMMPCTYCQKEADKTIKSAESKSHIKYTGIDRKDSSKGYTKENIVPCCTQCNMIKNNLLSYEEMIEVMKLVKKMRENSNPYSEER